MLASPDRCAGKREVAVGQSTSGGPYARNGCCRFRPLDRVARRLTLCREFPKARSAERGTVVDTDIGSRTYRAFGQATQ